MIDRGRLLEDALFGEVLLGTGVQRHAHADQACLRCNVLELVLGLAQLLDIRIHGVNDRIDDVFFEIGPGSQHRHYRYGGDVLVVAFVSAARNCLLGIERELLDQFVDIRTSDRNNRSIDNDGRVDDDCRTDGYREEDGIRRPSLR